MSLPTHQEAAVDDAGRFTSTWRRWLEGLERRIGFVPATETTTTAVAPAFDVVSGDGKIGVAGTPASGSVVLTLNATASDVPYDNSASGLTAEDVQAAIDEVAASGGGAIARTVASIASNTTAGVGGDFVYFISGTTTLTLPTAVGNTGLYIAKNAGSGSVTVDTTSSETIDGSLTQTLAPLDAMTFASDGSAWSIV